MAKKPPSGPSGSMSTRMQAGLVQQNDVVDAEFEIISDAAVTSIGPSSVGKIWAPSPSSMRRSMNLRQTRSVHDARLFEQAEEKSWTPWNGEPLSTPAFYALAVAIMAVSFWVSGGHSIFVSEAPERPVVIKTQDLPLDVRNVIWDVRYRAQKPVLFVNGNVHNPHRQTHVPQDLIVFATYKNGTQEKLFIQAHKQPLQAYGDYQFHGQLDLKHSEIASVSIELQKP